MGMRYDMGFLFQNSYCEQLDPTSFLKRNLKGLTGFTEIGK
jgi:hypothetical protein